MNLDRYLSDINSVYRYSIAPELFDARIFDLTPEIITQMEDRIGLSFFPLKDSEGNVCMANNKEVRPEFRQNFSSIDILDYMYALLYSSDFRSVSKKSSDINFQYPKDTKKFWLLAELGSEIKEIHSLKKIKDNNSFVEFCNRGNSIISNPHFKIHDLSEKSHGCIYINEAQYFENVPETVWAFTIENHQPAQKWLEDRKGQKMNLDGINYYEKILFALSETERLILKIDESKL